jgi:hypothetical protein
MNLYEWGYTWEEDVEASSGGVLSYENIEDVEGDFVKEITHNLEN